MLFQNGLDVQVLALNQAFPDFPVLAGVGIGVVEPQHPFIDFQASRCDCRRCARIAALKVSWRVACGVLRLILRQPEVEGVLEAGQEDQVVEVEAA